MAALIYRTSDFYEARAADATSNVKCPLCKYQIFIIIRLVVNITEYVHLANLSLL